ncbi:MAG: formyltetrahydrofolate deformylase [Candidatus Azotimanducaceae bacterium]|jgi:formyltetrahydrofolate deformylase
MNGILTLSCPDKPGLVLAVSQWLVDSKCNILESDQYQDAPSNQFFMRVHFEGETTLELLESSFEPLASQSDMSWQIWPTDRKLRVMVMVSKQDHCLTDLLYRTRNGELPIEISLVCSNHRDAYSLTASEDIDFLHLPINENNKLAQEKRLLDEIRERNIDLVVLARYMQILSPDTCAALPGRIINIHHSFLPGFKGARPYHQAFERGVKLIGATAHYVTPDLDEGPIIEQGVERVDHRHGAKALASVGRDIERVVLAKAVKYHAEHRVLLNHQKTVVFQ